MNRVKVLLIITDGFYLSHETNKLIRVNNFGQIACPVQNVISYVKRHVQETLKIVVSK